MGFVAYEATALLAKDGVSHPHRGTIYATRYNAQGDYFLTAGQDKIIHLWSGANRRIIKSYKGHGYEILGVAICADNAQFASCGGDRQVYLWDVASGLSIRKLDGHLQRVNCVEYNDTHASVLCSGSYDTTVRCWDLRAKNAHKPIQILTEAKDSVTSIRIREHDIYTSSVDGYVRQYDIRMGRLVRDNFAAPVTSIALSNDGQCLLTSTLNSTIRVLDKPTGELLSTYKGHKNESYKVDACFSHDDALVLSGSEDGHLHIWDLVDGDEVQRTKKHSRAVMSLAHHPEQPVFLTSGADGILYRWTQSSS